MCVLLQWRFLNWRPLKRLIIYVLRYSLPPYINNNSGISPSANPTISANSLRNILSIIFYAPM